MPSMQTPVFIPILRRVELNGSYLSASATRTITLPTVNTRGYYYAQLVTRVHDATWSAGSTSPASFTIEGFSSYPTGEDTREFVDSIAVLTASVTQSTSLPGIATDTKSDIAMALKFVATLTQCDVSSSSLFVVASAGLLLRPA